MIKFENVSKSFGKFHAVKDLSFELKKGDITGLLGPNGAGKTTTMRMISSFYFPDKGRITINGKDTKRHTLKTQQDVGYLPENNPLYLDMLVIDYLTMSANFYNLKKSLIAKRIEEVSKAVAIERKLARPMKELSKGFKQRVGIAAALIHDPSILVLDEPTEGLDPNQRDEIRKLIIDISKDKTILISTHVLQEVKAICNKVLVINEGKLLKFGKPSDISRSKTIQAKIEGSNVEEQISKLQQETKAYIEIKPAGENMFNVKLKAREELRPKFSELANKNKWTIWELSMEDSI